MKAQKLARKIGLPGGARIKERTMGVQRDWERCRRVLTGGADVCGVSRLGIRRALRIDISEREVDRSVGPAKKR